MRQCTTRRCSLPVVVRSWVIPATSGRTGFNSYKREGEIKRIYLGAPDAEQLIRNYGIEYLVVGPQERIVTPVNEMFFTRFQKVGEVGEYKLYKIR